MGQTSVQRKWESIEKWWEGQGLQLWHRMGKDTGSQKRKTFLVRKHEEDERELIIIAVGAAKDAAITPSPFYIFFFWLFPPLRSRHIPLGGGFNLHVSAREKTEG
eukprot:gene258-132_t